MHRIILIGLLLMTGAGAIAADTAPTTQPAAAAVNQFSADLFGHLPSDGNLFCSPLSIYTAVQMAGAGARGKTAEEISAVLHSSLGNANSATGRLLAALQSPDQDFQLHVANAMWVQNGFKCLPAFQNLLQADYACGCFNIDFSNPAAASNRINDWVLSETAGKIAQLFSPETLLPDTRLVLTNAIYFHADWQSPFSPERSAPQDFHVTGRTNPSRPNMMHQHGMFPLMHGDQFDALELPYKEGKVSMLIVLPKLNDGLAATASHLSADFWNQVIAGLRPEYVEVSIPKFSFTQQISLPAALKAMGIIEAFQRGNADFSGIDGNRDLFLSNVLHKAYVAVDEEGTEAAAATGAVMMPTAIRMPQAVFVADHPFLFVIRDQTTGADLFLGRVHDPAVE